MNMVKGREARGLMESECRRKVRKNERPHRKVHMEMEKKGEREYFSK